MNQSPLTVAEFERLLQLGLGRTILYLQQHDAVPYREAIARACHDDLRYDPQCERPRAPYLWELIKVTGDVPFYRDRILASLASADEDDGDTQLFRLARRFAQGGDTAARLLMYERFTGDTDKSAACALELLELDGIDGFFFVAQQLGLAADRGDWRCAYVLTVAVEKFGSEVRPVLDRAPEDNGIRRFLAAVENERRRSRQRNQRRIDATGLAYAELRPLLEKNEKVARLPAWGEHASDSDIEMAAGDLVELLTSDADPKRRRPFLSLFWNRVFPLDPQPILALAEQAHARRERAVLVNLLSNMRHPAVRAAALRWLASDDRSDDGVDLLLANYRDGDFVFIQRALDRITDREILHNFGIGVCDMLHNHETHDAVPTLLQLYERGPCSLCREEVVGWLLELDALPGWIVDECHYDANPDVRSLVEEQYEP